MAESFFSALKNERVHRVYAINPKRVATSSPTSGVLQ